MKGWITGVDIANTVRMAHSQRRATFLLLEGDTDVVCLRRFLHATCEPIPCFGRSNALAAAAALDETRQAGFLAVVDADFDRVENRPAASPNVIATEYHDLGIVVLCSSALDRLLAERASLAKLRTYNETYGDFRTSVITAAAAVGTVQLANERNRLSLRFDDMEWSRYIDRDSLIADLPAVINAVVQRSGHPCTAQTVTEAARSINGEAHDGRQLANGHVAVSVLSCALRRAIGSQRSTDVAPATLEIELRLAFDSEAFQNTDLYVAMRAWEESSGGWRVLAD